MRTHRTRLIATTVACLALVPSLARAQGEPEAAPSDAEPASEAPASEAPASEAPASEAPATAASDAASDGAVDRANEGGSPIELPGKTYYFVGLRYRPVVVPKFMMNLFGDGGRTVVVHSVGPEFTMRKDAHETIFSLWFANYRMKPTEFKAKDDPVEAWEIVESKINVLYLTADFLWSQEFSPEFALEYGLGAGFGFVFGDLIREQSYPPAGVGSNQPDRFVECTAPGIPNPTFCGTDNEHYNDYKEPSWANGGSKPVIFPWLAFPQLGLRFKPHRNVMARIDMGFSTSGFFFGFAGNYGI